MWGMGGSRILGLQVVEQTMCDRKGGAIDEDMLDARCAGWTVKLGGV